MDGSPKFLQDYTPKSVEFIRGHSKQVHGITDRMVCGKPTIEHVLPQFVEFLGNSDTILLAHNAPFDLGFLAMAHTRLGIAYPPHYVFDTLEMARRLIPHGRAIWSNAWQALSMAPRGHCTVTLMLAPHSTAIVDTIAHPRYARPIHEARRVHRPVLPVCRDHICPSESSPMEVT